MMETTNLTSQTPTRESGRPNRITLPAFLGDMPHAIFHVDRGIIFNFIQLFKRPGAAIEDYLAGNRKAFFHPASYLIIALLCNYLVVKLTDLHFYDVAELSTMTPLAAQAIRDYDALQWWFLEHTYLYILIAIPASTLFMFGIFRMMSRRLNVAETAVVVLFTIAQGVMIQSLIYLSLGWIHDGGFRRCMEAANMTILIFYASVVAYQLLPAFKYKAVRVLMSFIGGAGLAIVWIASAYLLYEMMK